MKKTVTFIILLLLVTNLFSQPILMSDSLLTGRSFNLFSLNNVNISNITITGENVLWDLSSTTATLAGTAEFLDMADTPYESEYPEANFAMKFTQTGGATNYSLFSLTSSLFVEVAQEVGTPNATSFINYRTTMVFPFTYNMSYSDIYQKENQEEKTVTNTYDGYGSLITNDSTFDNVVRTYKNDNGNTYVDWWRTSPLVPIFEASGDGFILWELTSVTTGEREMQSNLIFQMYPNPATNRLNIINKELISKIEIINMAGQLQFTTTQSSIDVTMLSKGAYFVKAFSEKGTYSQIFIKE